MNGIVPASVYRSMDSCNLVDLVHLINETASLTFLDCSGTRAAEESENVEIEKFCKQLISDVSRPQLEIVLGGESGIICIDNNILLDFVGFS